ncbi:MAG: ABC transporter permease [Eubacteriales bacterium]|nr:ABC transporter permease [Eubacteriales bacterium]
MNPLLIELQKEKRTGIFPVLLATGVLGALYAFANFQIRGKALLSLPLAPMDILLTQLYGMLLILNLFGIITAACILYHMEYSGNAIRKIYLLPISAASLYFSKFLLLSLGFLLAAILQNLALAWIGTTTLPQGTFKAGTLLAFAAYSFLTSMPVLSFMLFVSSRMENMWVTLGIGVIGFLSAMALANTKTPLILLHPFVVPLSPAIAMSARPDLTVIAVSAFETALFLAAGLWAAKCLPHE